MREREREREKEVGRVGRERGGGGRWEEGGEREGGREIDLNVALKVSRREESEASWQASATYSLHAQ